MKVEKQLEDAKFLTSNVVKAKTLKEMGIKVAKFDKEIPEVKDLNIETVALYKAMDTELVNILVEDTAFELVGREFYETQIKQLFKFIEFEDTLKGNDVIWKVAIAWRVEDEVIISTAQLQGKLDYPAVKSGYNFERILRVDVDGKSYMFPEVPEDILEKIHPRVLAAQKLIDFSKTGNDEGLTRIKVADVPKWDGEYQPEDILDPKDCNLNLKKKQNKPK